jgi:hypothetical protein
MASGRPGKGHDHLEEITETSGLDLQKEFPTGSRVVNEIVLEGKFSEVGLPLYGVLGSSQRKL